MSFFKSLFGRRPRRALEDPDFGAIEEDKVGSWAGKSFQLWGYSSIQVMLDGDADGPTSEQRSFIKDLYQDPDGIRARIERAIAECARKTSSTDGPLKLSSIYLPKAPPEQMWRVWYDLEGEDHYWYGAQVVGWQNIMTFTED